MSPPVTCRVTAPGDGAWFDAVERGAAGRRLRVAGAAPGDLLRVRPRPDDPPWGDAVDVLARGPGWRAPGCAIAGACGGCHWLHLDEEVQLAWKVRRLVALGLPVSVIAAPRRLGYRYKARFQVDASVSPWRVGYHGPGSTSVVDAPECPLLAPELAAVYRDVRARVPDAVPGGVTGLEIIALPGQRRGLLLLNPRDHAPDRWPACGARLLETCAERVAGVAVRLGRRDARPAVVGAPWLSGRTPGGHPVVAATGGFLQANLAAADALCDVVVRAAAADRGPRCLELHAGSGLLSWRLAAAGARVTAVERDAGAIRAAAALPVPERGRLTFECADASEAASPARLRAADVLVADPPRSGLGSLAGRIARHGPPRVVLVSCSMRALAADLAGLARGGYRVAQAAAIDLFPQTRFVETVTVFER